MRKLRIFVVWTLLATIMEMFSLYYVNRNWIKPVTSYTAKKIEVAQVSKKFNISIPDGAASLKVSDDGSYVSYYDENNLKVAETATGKVNAVHPEDNASIALIKWMPGSDILMIVEKSTDLRQRTYMKLYSYNADKNEKTERIANDTNKIGNFMVSSKNDKIDDACNSTQSESYYLKITNENSKYAVSCIYRINIMNEPEIVQGTQEKSIGKIGQIYVDNKIGDLLIYEDKSIDKVKVQNNNYISLPSVQNQCLLGVDGDNNIYIGDKVNEKITRIYYGTYKTPGSSWQNIKFDNPADINDIYINEGGKVYIIDNIKGTVTDFQTKKVYKFSGKFVQIFDGGIASLSNGKLFNTEIT